MPQLLKPVHPRARALQDPHGMERVLGARDGAEKNQGLGMVGIKAGLCMCCAVFSHSVVSDSLQPHGL